MKFIYVILTLLFISSCSLLGNNEINSNTDNSNIAVIATSNVNEKQIFQEDNKFINIDKNIIGDKIEMILENPIPEIIGINYLSQIDLRKKTIEITGQGRTAGIKNMYVIFSNKDSKFPTKKYNILKNTDGYDNFSFHASKLMNFYDNGENIYDINIEFIDKPKVNLKVIINVPNSIVLD
ncbi:MAG: hypothetical protein PHV23_04085 [Candidatus Gracilibacteria bacterium]|nr:hypothetical protein [Candidatus Gracilibacteria bacterium]